MIFKQRLFTLLLGVLFASVLTDQAWALYDPGVGRFCSRDPVGYRDSNSLYSYCRINPATFSDPYGTFTITGVARHSKEAKCGNTNLQWRISVDKDWDEAIIVQRICFSIRNTKCDQPPLSNCCTLRWTFSCYVCFYEILRGPHLEEGYSYDSWAWDSPSGSCGNKGRISIMADVRAFSLDLRDKIMAEKWDSTSNIVFCGSSKWSDDSRGTEIEVGTVLPGDSNPSWWGDYTSRGRTALLHRYDCCAEKQFDSENEEIRFPTTFN